jgi:hypothetical protein
VTGEGNAGGRNGEPGDLLVTVRIRPVGGRRGLRTLALGTGACAVAGIAALAVVLALD